MITPHIKPSAFFTRPPAADLFVQEQRQNKLGAYVCYIPRGGQIVDASIVAVPITQAKTAEREALNEGKAPEGRSTKRLQHTDRDARWSQKHGKSYYGYKVHGNVDARWKLIRRIQVRPANVDDGQTPRR